MGKLKIAKVVLPIATSLEFDYLVPSGFMVRRGTRVLVDFHGKKRAGIVVGFAKKSKAQNIKTILGASPCLNKEHVQFAKDLTRIYPYTLGEFLFMMLPPYIRRVKRITLNDQRFFQPNAQGIQGEKKAAPQLFFIKGDDFRTRYESLRIRIKEALRDGSVLICFPQLLYLEVAKKIIEKDFSVPIAVIHSQMNPRELFGRWGNSRQKSLILGTRVSLFYYPWDLKMIVIDEENSPFYFQEEKPFYHIFDVAHLLSHLKGTDLFLAGDYPSLHSYKLIKEKKIHFEDRGEEKVNIQLLSLGQRRKRKVLPHLLVELLRKSIEENKRGVVLYNRSGFARVLACSSCGHMLNCTTCSGFLRSTLKETSGFCPYCGKKEPIPKICPQCNTGYIRSFGLGIERVEAILKKNFPEARIDSWEKRNQHSQVILATSKILSFLYHKELFDIGFVLDADISLSRPDYDATFDTFLYFRKLTFFFKDRLYIFSRNSNHYLFQYVTQGWENFYRRELTLRRKLQLPPYGCIAKITLRAKNQNTLFKRSEYLYNRLKTKRLEVYGAFQERPFKLRGKFRYSIIIKSTKRLLLRRIIKEEIVHLRSSNLQCAIAIN
ncbi:MAG: hypothetical protein JSW40_03635 [Candidatus Omnitrophota bacterium]|nr:MAG: hypothetical protein JSW40_03635 [Candidatus Omnitrophota bacterium]